MIEEGKYLMLTFHYDDGTNRTFPVKIESVKKDNTEFKIIMVELFPKSAKSICYTFYSDTLDYWGNLRDLTKREKEKLRVEMI